MLLRVLQSFYIALGGFASATLASLLGAVVAQYGPGLPAIMLEALAVTAGIVGVAAMVHGSVILIRVTNITVRTITERAATVRARAANLQR
jgi:hypothetical protein